MGDIKLPSQFDFSLATLHNHFAKKFTYLVATMTCFLVCENVSFSFYEFIRQPTKLFSTGPG